MKSPIERMLIHLSDVYGEAEAAALLPRLAERLDAFKEQNPGLSSANRLPADRLSEG